MNLKFTYSQIVSFITYYLEKYPSVPVALECTLEDVEGDGEKANEIIFYLNRINDGEVEEEVLLEWGTKVGSRDLINLAEKIKEAKEKKKDIGFYVRKVIPYNYKKDKDYNYNKKNYNNKRTKR